ncbi:MAG: hypothetical protein KAJ19_03540 [Gammaproteobacteria bacterium]|nr:hypothetical protein [Gammaproteobacteria bacterium]
MIADEYMLVFRGEVMEGYDADLVVNELARMTGKERSVVKRLFSGGCWILKTGMNLLAAQKYQSMIGLTGAVVNVEKASVENQSCELQPVKTGMIQRLKKLFGMT